MSNYYRLNSRGWDDDGVSLQILKRGIVVDSISFSGKFDELFYRLVSGKELTQELVASYFFKISGKKDYFPLMLPNILGLPLFREDVLQFFGASSSASLQYFSLKCDDEDVRKKYFLIYDYTLIDALSNYSDCLIVSDYVLDSSKIDIDAGFFRLKEDPNPLFCKRSVYDFFSENHYSEWGADFYPIKSI